METNRDDIYVGISKAPKPSRRYNDFLKIKHPLKMITIEPVIDFDLETMISWMENINPIMIWLGYDSKRNRLSEPEIEKVRELQWELSLRGFTVILKKIKDNIESIKKYVQ